jgi:enamine deaminase RidA (YjgF/YER057c/UK114 family)
MSSSALQHISTGNAPGNPSIYSQAVVVGNLVYCSGSIGIDAKTVTQQLTAAQEARATAHSTLSTAAVLAVPLLTAAVHEPDH